MSASDDSPETPEPVPPHGWSCDQCAFFAHANPDRAWGECREDRPIHTFGGDTRAYYPVVPPGNPACSRFLTPEEWFQIRGSIRDLVADLRAGTADISLGVRP